MDIVHTHCAGLDVHKKTVVVTIIVPGPKDGLHKETRTFGTITTDLLALSDWLMEQGVTDTAMESTGKRRSGKTTKRNHALRVALNHAANAASHTKNTYLSVQYHRLAARRGKKKAIVALEHSILIIAYHVIQRREPYHELGSDYFDKRQPEATAQRLVKRLEHLGFQVSLQQTQASLAV